MLRTLILATCLSLVAFAHAGAAEEAAWLTDPVAAGAAASKANRPILADFTGSDWCGWCVRLKKEVFDTPEFKAWAAKNVVLLEVDFPRKKAQKPADKARNQALAEKYGIEGYPTIVLMDAAGKELGRLGYKRGGPEAWIAAAEKALGR